MTTAESPVGSTVDAEIKRHRCQSQRYREAHDLLAPFEQIARLVVLRRAELGLSQQDVAEQMDASTSVVSRTERGEHPTSIETFRRVAEALGGHAVFGFEFDDGDRVAVRL